MKAYWARVRNTAAELGSDGCSFATGAFRNCCLEHDISYRTGATVDGVPQTKEQSDLRFLACMQRSSRLGYYSPIAWIRYLIVKRWGKPKRADV